MKCVIALCLIALVGLATASPISFSSPVALKAADVARSVEDLNLCPTCVSFVSDALNDLIEIIVNGGVLGSCSALCGQLSSSVEGEVCDLLCSVVGIDAFVKLLDDADPDPIWICEELTVCPVNDNANATINQFTVSPQSGPQGTTFSFDFVFTVGNEIATGEIAIAIIPPGDAYPLGDAQLVNDVVPNSYQMSFQVQAEPSEDEPFNAGTYVAQIAVCEGTCGSKHSHSATLSVMNATFAISN